LSAAFDLDLEFSSNNCKNKANTKSGGQECPPHKKTSAAPVVTLFLDDP